MLSKLILLVGLIAVCNAGVIQILPAAQPLIRTISTPALSLAAPSLSLAAPAWSVAAPALSVAAPTLSVAAPSVMPLPVMSRAVWASPSVSVVQPSPSLSVVQPSLLSRSLIPSYSGAYVV